MPGFDGRGPRGEGPMTGGRRGYCATGAPRPAGAVSGLGRGGLPWGCGRGWGGGFGRGRGRGFGRNWGVAPLPAATVDNERRALADQLSALEEEMRAIRERIAQLDAEGENR